MSELKQVPYPDLIDLTQSWLYAYAVAGRVERYDMCRQMRDALESLRYFKVIKVEETFSNDPMVEFTGRFSLSRRVREYVKLDIINLCKSKLGFDDRTRISFVDTEEGFNFRFLTMVNEDQCFTGVVYVSGTR